MRNNGLHLTRFEKIFKKVLKKSLLHLTLVCIKLAVHVCTEFMTHIRPHKFMSKHASLCLGAQSLCPNPQLCIESQVEILSKSNQKYFCLFKAPFLDENVRLLPKTTLRECFSRQIGRLRLFGYL